MIRAQGLTKHFGSVIAVDGLDLEIGAGTWFLMVGHNGAGKTTTIRMLAGLLPPSTGEVEIGGLNPATHPVDVRRRVGYLPEQFEPYGYLTPREYLQFVGRVHGISRKRLDATIESLLELLELGDHANTLIRSFSQGMRKKVGIAAALVHDPDVLFLDEPTASLDPRATRLIRRLIRGLCDRGKVVFMSTHILGMAEHECDRIVVLRGGQTLLDTSPAALQADHPGETLEEIFLEVSGGNVDSKLEKFLETLEG